MATKISPITLDLLKLPIGVILGAHAIYNGKDVLGGTPADMKSRAVINLTALIESGALTVGDVARCTPAPVATTNVAQQADTMAVAAVANRAEQSALDAHQLLVKIKGALHEVATRLKDEKADRI